MPSLSNWTRPHGTWSRWSSHSSLMVTPQDKPSPSWFTREVTERLREEDFLSVTTVSLLVNLGNTESTASKTSSTRSSLADPNSRKPTTSCGQWSSHPHSVDLRSKDTPSLKDSVPGETERSSSTELSRRWCERVPVASYVTSISLCANNTNS